MSTVTPRLLVRAVRPAEYEAVAALTIAGFAHGRDRPMTPEREALLLDTPGRAADGGLLVAELDGRFVGTTTILRAGSPYARQALPGEAELRLLTVDPQARGSGTGAALLAAGEELARGWGAVAMVLDTGPRNPSRRLYERTGYVRQPTREHLPAVSGGMLVVYRKEIHGAH